MMKEAILDDSPHRDIRLNDVFNKITDIWQHQNSVTTGSKPTMTCDVIESVRSDLNAPISHGEYQSTYYISFQWGASRFVSTKISHLGNDLNNIIWASFL
uniref:Uncharacterized protein n=1 Tax=Cacopsylla melanoneura TaxID=428564 RepID=A0A8D8M0P2_9HEMI